jgi:hypothetical protein
MDTVNGVYASPKSMSEKEINSLVHDALMKARMTTKSFSPTKTISPKSAEAPSPASTNRSAGGRPPVSPLASPNTKVVPTFSHSPSRSKKNIEIPTIQTTSSVGSFNSSDDILRRVEEEIANARKAAQEATKRLAGVSANFMADYDGTFDMSEGTASYRSSSTDAEGNFDEALDILGEEFDELMNTNPEEKIDSTISDDREMPVSVSSLIKTFEKSGSVQADSYPMDELEMVLSDEREQDRLETNAEISGNEGTVAPKEVTEVMQDYLESDKASIEHLASIDEVKDEELIKTISLEEPVKSEDTDMNSREEEVSSPEASSPEVSKSLSSIEKFESKETKDAVGTKDVCIKSEIENSGVKNGSDEAEEMVDDVSAASNKNLLSHVAMTDDQAVSDLGLSEDQTTEIIDNKNTLTNRLLSNLSELRRAGDEAPKESAYSLYPTSPSRKKALPTKGFSNDASDSVDNADENSSYHGNRVQFKEKYPIPQKMKKSRQPIQIKIDYQLEKPSDKLWQSKPKKDLKELFEAITGTSVQRRSNACGALKVLSTQKKNQLMLVRTYGFMDALVFAISGEDYSDEDKEAGTAARTRAVNIVLNVSARKDNRYHVLLHPGLRESVVKCMMEDKREARELACAVLATLGKSQHCREAIGKTEKLVDTLAIILKKDDPPMPDIDHQTTIDSEKITVDSENVDSENIESGKVNYSGDDELSGGAPESGSGSESSNSFASSLSSKSSLRLESADTQKEDAEMRKRTRTNACAALLHLSKECSISQELSASSTLISSLVSCCNELENPLHTKCLEILANITRFPHNNARLVGFPGLVETLLVTGSQEDDADRLWSMRIFQNLSSEPSAKVQLATSSILELLSTNMMRKQYDEQLATTSTMYNISTEPGAVVPLTNTKNVVATLVHVAHSPASIMEVRTIACDALATLGLWLQTLCIPGTVPDGVKSAKLPSYITSGWERWED